MSQRFFTADLHLGHRAIVDHCHRPFASVEDMDARLIGNINEKVGRGDLLYILGDFSLGNREKVQDQRSMIRCANVYLIRGNHDGLSSNQYDEIDFHFKGDLLDLKVESQHITLCHYAMRRWNGSHRGAWHLYGHSHGSLADDPKAFAFDIGVDCHGYYPLSFPEVATLMAARTEAFAAPNHEDIAEATK